MNSDKFKKQIESMWKHRDTDEQKRLVKFTIAKTMRLTLEYPELAQEYFDSLCKVIPDNERITISNYQHNLTSDAEGEEMLTCEKSRVQQQYKRATQLKDDSDPKWELVGDQMERVLIGLFGSKCLPDNVDSLEPKPAEPKYHKDDKVLYNGAVHKITVGYGDGRYLLNNTQKVVKESDLEPYTEPEENVNLSQNFANCDKCPKSVQKTHPDFGHSRLNIAAMAMQGMLSNTTRFSSYEISDLVRISLNCADALIKEVEKGGDE